MDLTGLHQEVLHWFKLAALISFLAGIIQGIVLYLIVRFASKDGVLDAIREAGLVKRGSLDARRSLAQADAAAERAHVPDTRAAQPQSGDSWDFDTGD